MAEMQYITVKRVMLIEGEKQERYMPSLLNLGMIKPKDLADRIAKQSTISKAEAQQFMGAIADIIINDLEAGFSVKLGNLGTFSPAISAKSVKKIEACDSDTVRRKYIRFTPSADMKAEFKSATFRKANLDIKHV